MVQKTSSTGWQSIAHSVRGASHDLENLPNQDALAVFQWTGGGASGMTLAVADGHGSCRSFRSDVGSRLAVLAGIHAVDGFFARRSCDSLDDIEQQAKSWFPKAVVRQWRRSVRMHLAANPVQEAELKRLESERGSKGLAGFAEETNPYLAYGSTLLIAVVTERFALYVRIGDGEIMLVDESRTEPVRTIRETGPQLLGDLTHSLCLPDAERMVQVTFESFADQRPQLVFLSTDGYEKSFLNREGFLKVGSDLSAMLRTKGVEKVDEFFPPYLRKVTKDGSGDDITVAIAWSPEPVRDPAVNQAIVNQATANQAPANQPAESQAAASHSVESPATETRWVEDRATDTQPSEMQTTATQPVENHMFENHSAENHAAESRPAENHAD